MESEWHREVIRLGLQSSGARAAARQVPGFGVPGVTHWVTYYPGQWTGQSIVTVDDAITVTYVTGPAPYYLIKSFIVPDKPALPI